MSQRSHTGTKHKAAPTSAARTEVVISSRTALAVFGGMTFLLFFRIILQQAYLWEDFLYYSYPVRSLAATSMAAGYLPLWNPYSFAGMPFQADIQTGVFYIPNLLLTLFTSGGHLNPFWLELLIILHYPLAGFGMMLLARSYGMKSLPATVAGASYMLSGFMIVHAIHQQIVCLVAWYPLLAYLFRRIVHERRWLWVFVAGPLLGHAVFAGHPQFALYGFFLLGIVSVAEILFMYPGAALIRRDALLTYGWIAAAFAIAVGTTAIQLLPTMEMSGLTVRADMSYANSTVGSLSWLQILTLLFPKIEGSAGATSAQFFGGPYWTYWETAVYVGVLPLLLAVAALRDLRSNRRVLFFGVLALFGLLYALGGNFVLHHFFYSVVPGFSTFRNPARMGIVLSFALSILAGFGLEAIAAQKKSDAVRKTFQMIVGITAGAGLLFWIMLQAGALNDVAPYLADQGAFSAITSATFPEVVVLVGSALLLLGLIRKPGSRLLQLLLIPVFLVDMMIYGESQNTGSMNPAEYFRQAEPLLSSVKEQGGNDLYRINTRSPAGMILDRNQGMVDRVYTTEGYTPLALKRIYPPTASDTSQYGLLNVKFKTYISGRGSGGLVPNPGFCPRAFLVYRAVVKEREEDIKAVMGAVDFPYHTEAVVEKELPFRLDQPGSGSGNVKWTRYEPSFIECAVETDRNALLVFSEIAYPGWEATVDGVASEVYRTDYSLRGVAVSAGHHRVAMRYQPASFRRGSWITLGCLLLSVAGAGVSLFRSRHLSGVIKEH